MIIRELVTRLKFDLDKRGVENFNRSIIGFKTRLTLATSAVAGFVGGFVKALSQVANTIIETNDLARAVGLTTKEFVGLQEAARDFRIEPQQFAQAFQRISDGILQAREGTGDLIRQMNAFNIQITDSQGNFLNTRQVIIEILRFLEGVNDETTRMFLAQRLLGSRLFSDIAKEGVEAFEILSKENEGFGDTVAENQEKSERFMRALSRIGRSLGQVIIISLVGPLETVAQVLEGIEAIIKDISSLGLIGAIPNIGSSLETFGRRFQNFFGLDPTQAPGQQALTDFQARQAQTTNGNSSQSVNVNANVNVNVPDGTPVEQQEFLRQSAEQSFNEMFDNRLENILTQFPVVT